MKEVTAYVLSLGGSQLNKFFIFQCLSTLAFCGAIVALVTQKIILGYSLLTLGYCLLRKSDKEKEQR